MSQLIGADCAYVFVSKKIDHEPPAKAWQGSFGRHLCKLTDICRKKQQARRLPKERLTMGEITFMTSTQCSFDFFVADFKSVCLLLLRDVVTMHLSLKAYNRW